MVTIKDVARISGYSPSTVSRVINHSGYVSIKTNKKIKQVMKQLDYVPNAIAQDLSKGKTHKIGVVLPHLRHSYFSQMLLGIMDEALQTEYSVTLLPSEYDSTLEMHYLEQLKRKEYDGLIFTSRGISLSQLTQYTKYGPIVCCENPGKKHLTAAFSDRKAAYIQAFTWLKDHSIEKIVFLFSRPATISMTTQLTLDWFAQVYGHFPANKHIITNVTTPQDGYRAAQTIAVKDNMVQYFFTNGDDIAAAVRQYYVDQHLPVPGLIGQNGQVASVTLNIPTINHHYAQIGRQAFKLVVSPELKNQKIKIKADFVLNNQLFKNL